MTLTKEDLQLVRETMESALEEMVDRKLGSNGMRKRPSQSGIFFSWKHDKQKAVVTLANAKLTVAHFTGGMAEEKADGLVHALDEMVVEMIEEAHATPSKRAKK